MDEKSQKIIIYYDDTCRVCSAEINHYQKQNGAENILFQDISAEDFDPGSIGIDKFTLNKYFHVRKTNGEIVKGVAAFIEIWKTLPKYQRLARLAENQIVNSLLRFGYEIFVRLRPYLPKKNKVCKIN
ncbi:MAG: DUF393 domain-containing protein [Proteobacteria bacterium]|nr:DUF393 domain-containing protein [Pseudomonadota bacterium]